MLVLLIFLLTFSGGVLSGRRPPKHKEPHCPRNEHYVRKDTTCPKTCGNRLLPGETVVDCNRFTGCVCDSGYLRRYDNGTGPCIPRNKCAPIPKKCGKNEMRTSCKTVCPPQSCASMYLACDCEPSDCKPGCDCIDEHLRNEDGVCVPVDDCYLPGNSTENENNCIEFYTMFSSNASAESNASASSSSSYSDETSSSHSSASSSSTSSSSSSTSMHTGSECGKKCKDKNAVYKKCPNPCPLTCAEPKPRPCLKMCLAKGCECKPGFILSKIGGKCIKPDDCPKPLCPKREHYVMNYPNVIKTCGNRLVPGHSTDVCLSFTGCLCDKGYVRKYDNGTGPCIPKKQCPPIPKKCGKNEEPSSCRIICPPQSCESIYSSYYCLVTDCEPGCNCKDGYLRNSKGVCIPSETCPGPTPVCGENEVASDCKIVCPPQSCESIYTTYLCAEGPCTPGCNCKDGYLRNSLDVCIPSDQCFSESNPCDDPNASPQECASTCQPTCEDPDTSDRICTLSCRLGGCVCNPGYILEKPGGKCIKKEDCPKNQTCSDPNASPQDCPRYCQPTCAEPDTSDLVCPDACLPSGCVCNSGYILDKEDGTCIKKEDCPRNQTCADPNASPSTEECTSPCQPTCDQPDTSDVICILSCQIGACVCNSGYILDKAGGTCIKKEDCPVTPKCTDPNASHVDCPSYCQPTCEQPDTSGVICVDACLPSGCVCNSGYILNKDGGTCIKVEDCPGNQQCSDPNASPKPCPSYCQPTCGQRDTRDILCVDACLPSGCVCNPGYILEDDGGKCIKVEDCPDNQQCSDPNASPQHCPSYCQPTCNQPDTRGMMCIDACLPGGCVCNPGYILNMTGGTCIRREDCPGQECSDPNASPSTGECTSPCQPTCEEPDTTDIICIMSCQIGACVCNSGYILDKAGGKCIKIEDCPGNEKCKDPNASPEVCPSACQPTCKQPDTRDIICVKSCLPGGCVCNEDYILDKTEGTCIKPEECPGGSPQCRGNRTYVDCYVDCKNSYCPIDDSTGIVVCNRGQACSPGCACFDGYLMLSDTERRCILSSECPPVDCTRPNEEWDPSPSNCNRERCEDMDNDCADSSSGPPRCVCKSGYYRNSSDICVPASECDNQGCEGDRNATTVTCPNPHPPTCAEPNPNSGLSAVHLKYKCMSIGCECKPGFVFSEKGGKCIDPIDCPDNQSCNGDNNATIKESPNACPATCANPDTTNRPCPAICLGIGCECKPGFILNEGECIDPDDCPGGEPQCGANKTYVYCFAGCPDSYCPSDDSRDIIACDPPYPCPSSCDCKPGYLMLSYENPQCVLSSDCPPVTCTRPNECWDPSPSNCNFEKCDDIGRECDDTSTGPPRCVCKSGYYRNDSDICVPASECANQGCGGDRNATSVVCPDPNPPTCAEPRTNSGSGATDLETEADFTCMSIGCECKPGFILSKKGGHCINPSDCPDDQSCNGDKNATIKECPNVCPATCADPDTRSRPCPDICLGIGCECKPGFLLSEEGGECIDPDDCPGGEPQCGANKTYVYCFAGCPYSYCPTDDSRDFIACDEPYPCSSGCDCKPGYLMLSYENSQCVLSSDCPPVTCTRPNECWDPSPSNCNLEMCDDIDKECDDTSTGPPRCVCKSGFYRNASDICVPASECVNQGCGGDRNATSVVCPDPNPPTCAEPRTNSGSGATDLETEAEFTCMSIGCECKPGFILSKKGGQCIDPSDCPADQSCNGDKNATIKECPNVCPATCADPDTRNRPCPAICLGIGCECKTGFILSEEGGECIDPADCPGGEPQCGVNKTYVYCSAGCPESYCPSDDSRDIIVCDPPYPCPFGCDCEPGYLMLSYENPQCVLSSDCPPVTCTRPNECWDPSPSNCNLESCNDIGRECDDDTSTGPPRCVCKSGYYRNENDVCVPASECGCGGDRNATSVVCPDPNPPTCAEPRISGFGATDLETEADFTCMSIGCECKPGFVLSKKGGQCIDPSDCPDNQSCNGDFNATIKQCPNPCPATCANPDTRNRPCPDICLGIGCDCKDGFILSEDNGECINPKDCPGGIPDCGENKTYVDCFVGCPPSYCPTSDSRAIISCAVAYPCPPGCACKQGYLMLSYEDPRCVLSSECPPVNCTRQNEVWDSSPSNCYLESCEDIGRECDDTSSGPPRCICKSGYYRNESDICIAASECDRGCNGDPNAKYSTCPSHCPPTCEDSGKGKMCILSCAKPGCVCKPGYILSKQLGKCVKPEQCPPIGCKGDPNAVYSTCPSNCPRTCSTSDDQICNAACAPPGCVCKPGYVISDETGKCIKEEECPPKGCNGDPNAIYKECRSYCPRTCNSDDDQVCIAACAPPGCACKPGYVISDETGKCIKEDQCPPKGCKGDLNAVYSDCPSNCPRTCSTDDDQVCNDACAPPGCVCKPGYVISDETGKCIKEDQCPPKECKGDPNAVYSDCPSYCPRTCSTDDDQACIEACAPPGCVCKPGYVISDETGKCIKEDQCPPKGCKGDPNAVYSNCPSYCPRSCSTSDDQVCNAACAPPGCVCKPGYVISDETGKCIKEEECPPKECDGDPNAVYSDCPSNCPATCDDSDNQTCNKACAPPGCVCKPGYIISHETGKCVKPEDCPPKGCKGDPNAVYSECPTACPLTCDQPDLSGMGCIAACAPPGCVCKPGYLQTKKGKCVTPDGCPGGSPNCGANKTYVSCKFGCPTNYCPTSDTRAMVACMPPYPCYGGCACNKGYLFQDDIDAKCIKSSDCPPVKCTRPNEVWERSPSNCISERCEDMNTKCENNYPSPPRCVCKPGYYRNDKDICIPASKCPKGCKGDPNAVYSDCPSYCPRTCSTDDDQVCIAACAPPGCVCKPGYVISDETGKCIKEDQCPPKGCKGDPNAVYSDCPSNCPRTCSTDDDQVCNAACAPPGCVCKPGYVISDETGKCIKEDQCPPKGCEGDPNAVYSDCPSNCPRTCSTDDDQVCNAACAPPGCVCKPGYVISDETGKCIEEEQCPPKGCEGDSNAVYSDCPSYCPRTCSTDDDQVCIAACAPPGCVCKSGYVISDETGKCIKEDQCPPKGCEGDPNAVYSDCPSNCPRTCSTDDDQVCNAACAPPGCVCKPGYVISDETGKCIKEDQCPPKGCEGDPNAVHSDCPSYCPRTCSTDDDQVCIAACAPPGCVCKPGYVISDETAQCIKEEQCPHFSTLENLCLKQYTHACDDSDDQACIDACAPPGCVCKPGYIIAHETGKCVKPEECLPKGCKGDPNAIYSKCPTFCPLTCDQPDLSGMACIAACAPPGCVCKPGYLQTKKGKCVKPDGCPDGSPNCGGNKTYVSCKFGCPTNYCPTSDTRAMVACSPPYPCYGGCACNSGYLFQDDIDAKCIKSSDCPPVKCTRPNEVWERSPSNCISERCEDMNTKCENNYPSPPRCVCKPGYYRNDKDICIPASKCPKPPLKCGLNEKAVKCRTICPPQNCEIAYTEYDCRKVQNICEPGCDCLPNYLRNGSGICILNDDCPYPSYPTCGINEIARDCRKICPPQTCNSRFIKFRCVDDIPCEPGCDCVPNYLRNSDGVCIPADKCDASPPTKCPIPKKCIRTCASPNPPNCPYTPAKTNRDGCECKEGYILSEVGGNCIKIEDCPIEQGCNGDLHARTKQCPLPCPSTCDSPNATPCKKMCEPIGCECEPGYIFCKESGKCILPDDCPGGNPCGANAEFRQCKYNCPEDYCPVDDSRNTSVCDPWPVCMSGCVCKLNHRRLSREDDRCIVASDCPPVNCTRQNEVWDGCPSECFSGFCEDKEYQDVVCNTLLLNCQPKCICKRDYFRNGSEICVPESECPPTCSVPDECRRTCDSPNPPNCPYEPSDTNIDGCNCMEGYILSEIGGECIKIEECPSDGSCNGDPNARPKRCPIPCPSTCKSPEAVPCRKRCDPIGCECKPGYILSKTRGQCIKPEKCPGGNPCGPNANFVSCKNGCPTDYCPIDDSRAMPICEPIPEQYCLSGCRCKLNHKWLSRENKTCIVSSNCPPVNCTRQNEVWDGCPSECFSGFCEDKEYQDVVCNTLLLNCQPKCICKRDYFRNGSEICVPESECPPTCSVPDECRRTCDSPNPPNCPYEPSDTNIDGCNCMEGYILSEIGGECIKIEECPSYGSCNGDPNARPKRCPIPCPSTCKSPEAVPCRKRCDPIGCECKPGYILSKTRGQCIKPEKCPGGNPCGPNANFVPCKNGCPTDYCPIDDSRAMPICEPIPEQYCLSGCRCKLNHKWLSRENKTCIVSSNCPPVNCTRPNEKWNSCPSACLAERCEDVGCKPRTCQTLVLNCQPACICKKNFYRNQTDICVPPCDC